MKAKNQKPTEEGTSRSRKKIKIRYYVGANKILYFYVPVQDGIETERVVITDQKWPEEIVKYITTKGRHRVVKHYGYSRVLGTFGIYRNDVYIANVSVKRLLRLIKSVPSWERSDHARRIVQLLRRL
jgi:hypothetical protein